MANLGTTLADLFYPQRLKIAEQKRDIARKTLKDLNDAIARGEADLERGMGDKGVDPNILMQKKQALDSFKEHMYYDKNSPYRQAFITLYGYPPEQSPSMQSALMRGEEGARMVKLPSRPMLPEEEATKEEMMAKTMTQRNEQRRQGLLKPTLMGETPTMTPEQKLVTLGPESFGQIIHAPGLGVQRIPPGGKPEQIGPPYATADKTDELLNLLRLSEEQRKEEDQKAQMFDDANKAVNETIASLVENKQYSADEVGGVKGGGIGRVIIDDPDLRKQIKRAFDATPYAQKYGMTVDFVEPTVQERAFLFMGFLRKDRKYVTIALVPKGQKGKTTQQSSTEETNTEQQNVLNKSQGATRGF